MRESRELRFLVKFMTRSSLSFSHSHKTIFSVLPYWSFFPYWVYLLINVEWASERTLCCINVASICRQRMLIISVIWEYKIRALIWRIIYTFLLITCICKLRVSWLIALPIWFFSPDYHPPLLFDHIEFFMNSIQTHDWARYRIVQYQHSNRSNNRNHMPFFPK